MGGISLKGASIGFDDFDGVPRLCVMRGGSVVTEFELDENPDGPGVSSNLEIKVANPPSATISLPVGTPDLPPAKFARVLPQYIDAHLPIPVADCSFACVAYGGSDIAYVTRDSDLRSRLETLSAKHGIDPVRVVPLAHALWEYALAGNDTAGRGLVIAFSGETRTLLVAGAGAAPETQVICPTNPAEIATALRLAFAGGAWQTASLLIAAGPRHRTAGEAFKLFANNTDSVTATPGSPAFYAARAIASETPGSGWFRDANLRTGVFAHKSSQKSARRKLVFTAAAFALLAAVLFAVSHRNLATASRREAASAAELRSAVNEVAGYNVASRGAHAVEAAKAAAPARIDPAVEAYRLDTVAAALDAATRFCGQHGVKLKSLSITAAGVSASGEAPDAQSPAALAGLLAGLGLAAQLAEPPKQAAPDAPWQFMIVPLR